MSLRASLLNQGEITVIALEGKLDFESQDILRDSIVNLTRQGKKVVVDMEGLNFVGSSGITNFIRSLYELQERGLALGASYENGIALREDGYDTPLRFEDELARHKLLDLIGDLSLVGRPLAARVIAVKPSHTLNCRFARLLASAVPAGVDEKRA